MVSKDKSLNLTPKDLASTFADPQWAAKYPPVLTTDQAAELLQVSKMTIYDWSSRGLLGNCSRRVGKHLRIFRDRFLLHIFNEGLTKQ